MLVRLATKLHCIFDNLGRRKTTDSLDWSRKFEVLTISRVQLETLGIPHSQVASLTDEDMQAVAASIAKTYPDFENRVRINARAYLLK